MIALIGSLFTALANIKAIAGYIELFAGAVTSWYIGYVQDKTQAAIADSIALLRNAKTDDDRYKAGAALLAACSRPRITS